MEMHPESTEISNTIVGQSQIPCIVVYPLCMFTQELQHSIGLVNWCMSLALIQNFTFSQKKSHISRKEKGNFLCC